MMMSKSSILIYSDFDFNFSKVINNLKSLVDADLFMISRNYELDNIINSISIELIIVNLSSQILDKALVNKMMEIKGVSTLFLFNNQQNLNGFDFKKRNVFLLPLNFSSDSSLLGMNVNSILALSKTRNISSSKEAIDHVSMDKNLCRYIMELDHKNKTLSTIKSKIDQLCEESPLDIRSKLKSLSSVIHPISLHKKYWEDFTIYFEKVNPQFISRLSKRHPKLTTKDLKYCCYLKMNMSNNDIKNLLSINQDSVRTHKYRLKKKLGLKVNDCIRSYLQLEKVESPALQTA